MKELKEQICIRKIHENIKRVFEGKALTMPLATLNRDCRFRKLYDAHCDIVEADKIRKEKREYNQRKKEYQKEYQKEYYQKPEVKQRIKETRKLKRNEIKS